MRRLVPFVIVMLAGCTPSVGEGDQDAAKELVYDSEGVPAFAGQAIVIRSCGAGGFCHADTALLGDQLGAPSELTFNLLPASTTVDVQLEAAERLTADQFRIVSMAGSVWGQVRDGRMPPGGEVGAEYHAQVGNYDRVDTLSGFPTIPMPRLEVPEERDEALEILRNWLASGAPVIERTQPRADRVSENLTGFTQQTCERGCVDIRWPAIYERVIVPSCASSRCHDDEEPGGRLDLYAIPRPADGEDDSAYLAAVMEVGMSIRRAPMGELCMADVHPILDLPGGATPGNAENSLLYLKIAATNAEEASCGSFMPLTGSRLSPQRLCVIRSWINCGACVEPDGGACAACFDAARTEAECNLLADGSGCAMQQTCATRPPEPMEE